ncbi:hypothetical protein I4U23_003655 [Adineta vaga]|nr:hypothetical protein I4U23_003655 [Adineta vaga]
MLLAVVIDLSTVCSCVGVFRHDKVEIIPNDQVRVNTDNAIFDVKRLIGRKFIDASIRNLNYEAV